VHRSAEWGARLLTHALRDRGVRFSRTRVRSHDPYLHSITQNSPPLKDILKPFLKASINLIGEDLFKLLGQIYGDPKADLLSAGKSVMRDYLKDLGSVAARASGVAAEPGFFVDDVSLSDGSGVSRLNSVTTDAVMALLLDLRARPDFPYVWDGLPIAGVDGTLRRRMKGTAAEGVLRAKTGTLSGVYNLSGFVPRLNDAGTIAEFVPFVVLTKTNSAHRADARGAQDKIGAALAALVSSKPGVLK
jgi:D-alanyl-D-alanine carboxypeptidase/D-alanyl-D-alanine-endopeptidase (penicillin-binding protein 4)